MKKEVIDDNSSGILAVGLGIISIVTLLSSFIPAFVMGVIGIVFSLVQKKKSPNSWSKAGIILNLISIILSVLFYVLAIIFIIKNPSTFSQLDELS